MRVSRLRGEMIVYITKPNETNHAVRVRLIKTWQTVNKNEFN